MRTTTSTRPPRLPSRRVVCVLICATLASAIAAGMALGSRPHSSLAGSDSMQRGLAALLLGAYLRPVPLPSTSPASAASRPPAESGDAGGPEPEAAGGGAGAGDGGQAAASAPAGGGRGSSASEGESAGVPGEEAGLLPGEGSSGGEGSPAGEGAGEGGGGAPSAQPVKLPPIKHVWLIALSQLSFSAMLAHPAAAPYLAHSLLPKGTLLSGYRLVAASGLANGIALVSGQAPNPATEQECPAYSDVQPTTVSAGLAQGTGCVYPAAVQTLPDELATAGLSWRAYVQGMGGACMASARNPFAYFHSLLVGGVCAADDVDLGQLGAALAGAGTAGAGAAGTGVPAFSWIAPSGSGAESDAFLKEVVPEILASGAYREGGLIAIVPDSPPTSGSAGGPAPSSGPAAPEASGRTVGALLISPFVREGARVSERFDDFSLLKSLERLFGVLPLGHSGDPQAASFGAAVYRTSAHA
ncbi:MAG: alkaline phosphatase family protein [Solirubrobacteraceae bacterium]